MKGNSNIKIHLFVYELKKDRIIDKAMFSVFLGKSRYKDFRTKVETRSHIIFGGYDESILEAN